MNARRILEYGGLVAGVVLIVFGAAAIWMGVDGRSTVRDSLKQEQIYFGEATIRRLRSTRAAGRRSRC